MRVQRLAIALVALLAPAGANAAGLLIKTGSGADTIDTTGTTPIGTKTVVPGSGTNTVTP
jgi:hypothetical protein